MEPLSPGQQAVLQALQKVDPSVTEAHFRALDPAIVNQLMGKVMMSGPDVPTNSVGQQVGAGMGDIGHLLLGAVTHPLNTAGALLHGAATVPANAYNATFGQTAGEAPGTIGSRGGIRSGGMAPATTGQTPEQMRAAQLATGGNLAALPLAAVPFVGPMLAGGVAGAANSPAEPWRGATSGALAGAPFTAAQVVPAMGRGLAGMTARSRVANAAAEVPGGAGTLPATAAQFTAPNVPNALTPNVFDLHSGLSNLLTKAMGDNPAIRAYWEGELAKRAAAKTPTIAEGIRQQTYADLSPQFDEVWAKNAQVDAQPFREKLADLLASKPIAKVWDALKPNADLSGPNIAPDFFTNFGGSKDLAERIKQEAAAGAGAPAPVAPSAEILQALKLKLEGLTEQARRGGGAKRTEFNAFKDAKDAVNDFLNEHVEGYSDVNNEWARRMQLADKADEALGPGIQLGAHSTGVEPTNPGWSRSVQKTLGKFGLSAWDQAVANRVSDLLATPAAPQSINDLLASLPKRGTYAPRLQNRPGFVDLTSMTPEQAAAWRAARNAPPPAGLVHDIAPPSGTELQTLLAQQAQAERGNPWARPTSPGERLPFDDLLSTFEQFAKQHQPPKGKTP